MNTPRDPDRLIHDFLMEGATELADPVYDDVRASIEQRPQRVVIGPWRMPDMNKLVPFGLGAAALVAVLAIGSQLLGPAAPSGVGGAPPAESTAPPSPPPVGGTVQFHSDGAPATTVVTAVADGASVSGTAVSTLIGGTHTVRLECAVRAGDTWAFGGTTEQTTVPDERAGAWSAVVVKDGSPQQIGIVLSIEKLAGSDCDTWLGGSMDLAGSWTEDFPPVESGALVPPPDLAP